MVLKRLISTIVFDFTNSSVGYTVLGYNVAESQLNVLEKQGQLLVKTTWNWF
jgi:outer membrane receptor for ferrienterochelin and colicins